MTDFKNKLAAFFPNLRAGIVVLACTVGIMLASACYFFKHWANDPLGLLGTLYNDLMGRSGNPVARAVPLFAIELFGWNFIGCVLIAKTKETVVNISAFLLFNLPVMALVITFVAATIKHEYGWGFGFD